MRVITGSAKGRNLEAPPGTDTRPTAARVKEAVLSMIHFELENANVIDLFAGSGQMGIEALSRGARHCVFVDTNKASVEAIRKNLKNTKLEESARVVGTDALSYLATTSEIFDIAFADPPYDKDIFTRVLEKLAICMSESGIILCETSSSEDLPENAADFKLMRSYRYGKTKITMYKRAQ